MTTEERDNITHEILDDFLAEFCDIMSDQRKVARLMLAPGTAEFFNIGSTPVCVARAIASQIGWRNGH